MMLLALPPNRAIMAGPRFTLGLALPLLDLQKGIKKEFHRLKKKTGKNNLSMEETLPVCSLTKYFTAWRPLLAK